MGGYSRAGVIAGVALAMMSSASFGCSPARRAVPPEREPPIADASVDAPSMGVVTAQRLGERPSPSADGGVATPLQTVGGSPIVVAQRDAGAEGVAVCSREERGALTFEHAPIYTDHVDRDGAFQAKVHVGNASRCTRRVSLPLSFTPPRTTATRTLELIAHVPSGGAVVSMSLSAKDLDDANIHPGRYAVTFAVFDEDGKSVGRALSGQPLRRGRDDVAIVSRPSLPTRIAANAPLVIPLTIENRGDTANRVTPLVVFTRPGHTPGIEHYGEPLMVVPGVSKYTVRVDQALREEKKIDGGSWLLTVTTFDAAGDRMNSFAGLPLTIGTMDLKLKRPDLPVKLSERATLHVAFEVENRGDTPDEPSAVVSFTKPGEADSKDLVFKRVAPPGRVVFDAAIDPATRRSRGVGKGAWLVTISLFSSAGERVKSFTGHYLEIVD